MSGRALPRGLGLWSPSVLVATWFGVGFLPVAPGTWGSLAALPFAWLIQSTTGSTGLLVASGALFLVGWQAASVFVRRSHEKDPRPVVVDEVAGQWLVLAAAPLDVRFYALGLVLFRLADIVKPWPASWADRELQGGLGVMADDLLAAVWAFAALAVAVVLVPAEM
jgi:phosphatidylglycerophosphatase A